MPVTTTTVTTRSTTSSPGVAVHTISFRGLAGGIFLCLVFAAILYVIGFATTGWAIHKVVGNGFSTKVQEGLWETCQCRGDSDLNREDWFKAVQAMITIGLIGILIAMILACVYLCVHTVSKNATILALVIVCFLAAIFMLIGFMIYGIKQDGLNWSFAITVIAAILTVVAGVLSVIQMRQSGVRM